MGNSRRESTWSALIHEVCILAQSEKKEYVILRYHTTQLHWYLPLEELKDSYHLTRLPTNYHPVAYCWAEPLWVDHDIEVSWSKAKADADFKEHFDYPDDMPVMIKNTLPKKEGE